MSSKLVLCYLSTTLNSTNIEPQFVQTNEMLMCLDVIYLHNNILYMF